MTGSVIILLNLVYSGVLNIVFFTKKHLKLEETKVFSIMLLLNFFGLTIELFCTIISTTLGAQNILSTIFTRVYLLYLIAFLFFISYYILVVCYKSNEEKENNKLFKIFKSIFFTIFVISIFFIFSLPIETAKGYATGQAVNFVFASSIIHIALSTIIVIINLKKVNFKKFIPFFTFIFFLTIVGIIQIQYPEYTLITSVEFLMMLIMYFTIENPDLKMIEELSKTKNLSESTNDEKSKFIFDVTEDVKNSLRIAENICNNVDSLNPTPEIEAEIKSLRDLISTSRIRVSNTIDVSKMDEKHLKSINNKYNIKNVLNVICLQFKDKNPDIDFRYNIATDLPDELYGDQLKLKQIIETLLNNAYKYTQKGFIELRVNHIIKYDVCRLIISVEDSGIGMDLLEQNAIINNHDELTENEIQNLDGSNLNLKTIRKLINLIGGNISINSKEKVGTKINVNIDQKIVSNDLKDTEKSLQKYQDNINNTKQLAIISTNTSFIKNLKKASRASGANLRVFNETLDCLDLIRKGTNFDLVFIDENMDKINAKAFLSKVREVNYKVRIIVITDYKDIKYKKDLLNDGFNGIVQSYFLKKEIISIINS